MRNRPPVTEEQAVELFNLLGSRGKLSISQVICGYLRTIDWTYAEIALYLGYTARQEVGTHVKRLKEELLAHDINIWNRTYKKLAPVLEIERDRLESMVDPTDGGKAWRVEEVSFSELEKTLNKYSGHYDVVNFHIDEINGKTHVYVLANMLKKGKDEGSIV